MAPSLHRLMTGACILLASASLVSPLYAQNPGANTPFDRVVRLMPDPQSGDRVGAQLVRSTGNELIRRSPTFASLAQSLMGFKNLSLILRPASLYRLLGRGRYGAADGWITGVIEINPYPMAPGLRVRALAHELAHAFEIACVSRGATLAAGVGQPRTADPVETPFAQEIERVVAEEWRRSRRAAAQLAVVAHRHHLPTCTAA